MRRWRAITARAIVFLLLGAIVNVAVAWSVVHWAHPLGSVHSSIERTFVFREDPSFKPKGREISVEVQRTFGGMSVLCQDLGMLTDRDEFQLHLDNNVARGGFVGNVTVPSWTTAAQLQDLPLLPSGNREDAFGWPRHSMRCHFEGNDVGLYASTVARVHEGIQLAPQQTDFGWKLAVGLPLRPIWPGFAINTVFYAAALWGLFAAPFALRRRRRIKRGLCPKCAYDLRGSTNANACPECGTTR